jgi:signal transduction histidine kinase
VPLSPPELVSIVDALLEGLQVIGPDWRYLHVNEAAARHGRTNKEALLGRTMMECFPGIETTEVFALLRRSLVERSSHVLENVFTFPDGSTGTFELRIEPVAQGVCILSVDVTARKEAEQARLQAEERLRHAQRMEAIGQLAAGIAHDFNNLLTVMLAQGETALERPEGPSREDVETMIQAVRSSADLTRQMLAYGRRSVLMPEVLDLAEVVHGFERILRGSIDARIELRVDMPPGLGRVEADRSQLEQILLNLVVNARDAIPGTGRITVGLASADLDEDYVRLHPGTRPGPHLVLVVTDTGAGMDAATRARIFEPFFTTKELGRGTGLGLATVYGIVKQHGGDVWVYSEPGRGTTFKVYLPATTRTAEAVAPSPQRPTAPPPAQTTLLLAEDDPMLRRLLTSMLSSAGYQLLVAARGDDALRLWDEHHGIIALVITDVMMPGMPGPDLVRRMRERRPDLPVICTSGYSDAHLAERGSLLDNVVFIEKPFTPKVLRQQVAALLPQAE